MRFWEPDQIARVLGGEWLRGPSGRAESGGGASIDTRSLSAGQVFFAFRGERVDGHAFVLEAERRGALMAVVDRGAGEFELPGRMPVLRVGDVGRGLYELAWAYRRSLPRLRVVAVTGSNGKTTTVRLIDEVLSRELRGKKSAKSFNNALGVPLTVLKAEAEDDYLVAEVGMNAAGEIAPLARLLQPDVGVITSIGRAHLEGLGSVRGIAREKCALLAGLRGGSVAVMPAGVGELEAEAAVQVEAGVRRVRVGGGVGGEGADAWAEGVTSGEAGLVFSLGVSGVSEAEGLSGWAGRYEMPLLGRHNATNGATALCAAWAMGVSAKAGRAGLARASAAEMRLQSERVKVDGGVVEVVNDAYNANPESMSAALETLGQLAGDRPRVAILGDMLEMGEAGPEVHRELGELLVRGQLVDRVVFVGRLMMFAAERVQKGAVRPEVVAMPLPGEGWAREAAGLVRAGEIVLVKGSRGMGMEAVVSELRRRAGEGR